MIKFSYKGDSLHICSSIQISNLLMGIGIGMVYD